MKKIIAIVFGLVIGLTISYDTYATHLAGGSIRYDYVGPTPGSTTSWRYKITVFAFRYCGAGNTATTVVVIDQKKCMLGVLKLELNWVQFN